MKVKVGPMWCGRVKARDPVGLMLLRRASMPAQRIHTAALSSLPEPVGAMASSSRPASRAVAACRWMGVGSVNPAATRLLRGRECIRGQMVCSSEEGSLLQALSAASTATTGDQTLRKYGSQSWPHLSKRLQQPGRPSSSAKLRSGGGGALPDTCGGIGQGSTPISGSTQ